MLGPQLIYHYTSLSSCIGILTSNSVYATHVRFLNDTSEYDFGLAYIRECVENHWRNTIKAISNKLMPPKRITGLTKAEAANNFKGFLSSFIKPFTDQYLANIHSAIIRRGVYATCFCQHDSKEEIESGILSQWRAYASGGLAIGFDTTRLELALKRCLSSRNVSGFARGEVMYVGHTPGIEGLIREATGPLTTITLELFTKMNERIDFSKISVQEAERFKLAFLNDPIGSELGKLRKKFTNLSYDLAPIPALIKHHSFREERETRILVWPANDSEAIELNPKFLTSSSLVKPYLELSSNDKLPISHILIGPHPEQERRAEAIRMALKQFGFKVNVTCSRIPLTM